MKYRDLIIGLLFGLIAGFVSSWLICTAQNNRYALSGGSWSVKMDTKTGEAWYVYPGVGKWIQITNSN